MNRLSIRTLAGFAIIVCLSFPISAQEPQTCSRPTAHWLNARDDSGGGFNTIADPDEVFCQDFRRLGLMLFIAQGGSDICTMAVYRLTSGRWKEIQDIGFDIGDSFRFALNGDLIVTTPAATADTPHPWTAPKTTTVDRWHWNGKCFETREAYMNSQCHNP